MPDRIEELVRSLPWTTAVFELSSTWKTEPEPENKGAVDFQKGTLHDQQIRNIATVEGIFSSYVSEQKGIAFQGESVLRKDDPTLLQINIYHVAYCEDSGVNGELNVVLKATFFHVWEEYRQRIDSYRHGPSEESFRQLFELMNVVMNGRRTIVCPCVVPKWNESERRYEPTILHISFSLSQTVNAVLEVAKPDHIHSLVEWTRKLSDEREVQEIFIVGGYGGNTTIKPLSLQNIPAEIKSRTQEDRVLKVKPKNAPQYEEALRLLEKGDKDRPSIIIIPRAPVSIPPLPVIEGEEVQKREGTIQLSDNERYTLEYAFERGLVNTSFPSFSEKVERYKEVLRAAREGNLKPLIEFMKQRKSDEESTVVFTLSGNVLNYVAYSLSFAPAVSVIAEKGNVEELLWVWNNVEKLIGEGKRNEFVQLLAQKKNPYVHGFVSSLLSNLNKDSSQVRRQTLQLIRPLMSPTQKARLYVENIVERINWANVKRVAKITLLTGIIVGTVGIAVHQANEPTTRIGKLAREVYKQYRIYRGEAIEINLQLLFTQAPFYPKEYPGKNLTEVLSHVSQREQQEIANYLLGEIKKMNKTGKPMYVNDEQLWFLKSMPTKQIAPSLKHLINELEKIKKQHEKPFFSLPFIRQARTDARLNRPTVPANRHIRPPMRAKQR